MDQFSYRRIDNDTLLDESQLNELGEQGFRLVQVLMEDAFGHGQVYTHLLIKDGPPPKPPEPSFPPMLPWPRD